MNTHDRQRNFILIVSIRGILIFQVIRLDLIMSKAVVLLHVQVFSGHKRFPAHFHSSTNKTADNSCNYDTSTCTGHDFISFYLTCICLPFCKILKHKISFKLIKRNSIRSTLYLKSLIRL